MSSTNTLKTGSDTGRVSSSWSISGTRRVDYFNNLMIGHERGNKKDILTTSNGAYPWSSVVIRGHLLDIQ